MSLINDALKRARDQQPAPEPPASQGDEASPMQPVERHPRSGSGSTPVIGGLVAIILLMAGILFYLAGQSSARSLPPNPVASSQPATPTPPVVSVPSSAVSSPIPESTEVPGVLPPPEPAEPVVASVSPTIVTQVVAPTVVTQVVVVASNATVPAPPALRLQGVFYRPSRPSAVINGKTVFIGERVGEARVLSITPSRVTVVQGGETNTLSLE